MKQLTHQQRFLSLILTAYISSHGMAFYAYYNPPINAWEWVDKITVYLPQLGDFRAFRAPHFQIGSRIAFFLAVTYLPMLIVGILVAVYGLRFWGKKSTPVPPFIRLLLMLMLISGLCAIHYAMYWVGIGYGRKLDLMHPLLFSWPPILCGFTIGAIFIGTYQLIVEKNDAALR